MMSRLAWIGGLVLSLMVGSATFVGAEPAPVDRVAKLVGQLGDDQFRVREYAFRELEKIGAPALVALEKAMESDDMEIRRRATELVESIRKQVSNVKRLSPTLVEINCSDKPLVEVVADLSKQSGIPITLEGDIQTRKVTLQTGKVSFWQAFDLLCAKAEVAEAEPAVPQAQVPPNPRGLPVPIRRNLPAPIQVQPLPIQVQPLPIRVQPLPIKVQPIQAPAPEPIPLEIPGPADKEEQQQAQLDKEKLKQKVRVQPRPVMKQIQVQVAPAIQVQALPAIAQIQIQPVPFQGGFAPANMPAPQATAIRLADAKGKSSIPPTHYEGAVRVRAVSVEKAKELSRDAGEITLALQVSPEPKLGWQQLVGVSITKAIDDQDQELTSVPMDATANAAPLNMNGARQIMIRQNGNGQQIIIIQNGNGQQQVQIVQMGGNVDQVIKGMTGGTNQIVPVRLKRGTRDTTSLKEVSGVLTAKVRSGQEELLRINDILNAKGMTAKGEGNTSVKVLSVASSEDGDIKIEVELSYNNEVTFEAAQIKNPALADAPVANGAAVPQLRNTQLMGISLKDEKGEPLEAVMQQVSQSMVNNTTMTIKATYMFRPIAKGQTPKSLTLKGSCPTTIEVPFVLKNVQVK